MEFINKEDFKKLFPSKEEEIYENKWIPVKDRLPENDESVLILTDEKQIDMGMYVYEYDYEYTNPGIYYWYVEKLDGSIYKVTHWMPLPSLPEEK